MTELDTAVKKKTRQKLDQPKKWRVIMINDDVTTMEFVIFALMQFFKHSAENAQKLMMEIHQSGSAVVGVYSYEIAEAKSIETTNTARANNFPLQVKIEQEK